jgi:hypothetical protein
MTIEIGFVPDDSDGKEILRYVPPGGEEVVLDTSTEPPSLVAVQCAGDDGGGRLFWFSAERTIAIGNVRAVPRDLYNQQTLLGHLATGASYERQITCSRGSGRLVVRHVVPGTA